MCKAQPDCTRLRAIWKDLVEKICHTKFKKFYSAQEGPQEEKALTAAGKVVRVSGICRTEPTGQGKVLAVRGMNSYFNNYSLKALNFKPVRDDAFAKIHVDLPLIEVIITLCSK